jgi:hypothetical protein
MIDIRWGDRNSGNQSAALALPIATIHHASQSLHRSSFASAANFSMVGDLRVFSVFLSLSFCM